MNRLTIGELAAQSGVRARTIHFYEAKGLLPAPQRSGSGYRLYSQAGLLRLRFIRQARLLGLGLPAIKTLATQAFSANCAAFSEELEATIARQRAEVERRLTALQRHVAHCCEGCSPEEMAADCDFCGLISVTEGGEK